MKGRFADVDPDRRAGVALDEMIVDSKRWQRTNRRPPTLTPREALAALEFEALLVSVSAFNLANGIELSEADLARLALAYRRIDLIASEAGR